MNLTAQIDRWEAFWEKTNDPAEIERQLSRLRWLQDFAFECRESLDPDCYRAVKQEIARGERRLAELDGIAVTAPEQPDWVTR